MDGHEMDLKELLEAWAYCMHEKGGDSCTGCPNAIPGTEDDDGFCQCRVDLKKYTVSVLQSLAEE